MASFFDLPHEIRNLILNISLIMHYNDNSYLPKINYTNIVSVLCVPPNLTNYFFITKKCSSAMSTHISNLSLIHSTIRKYLKKSCVWFSDILDQQRWMFEKKFFDCYMSHINKQKTI